MDKKSIFFNKEIVNIILLLNSGIKRKKKDSNSNP